MEDLLTHERKAERITTPSKTEALLGAIEDGRDMHPDDFVSTKDIYETFEWLRELHLSLMDGSVSTDPRELLQLLRETKQRSRDLRTTMQTCAMVSAVAQLAHMDTSPQWDAEPSPWLYVAPQTLAAAELPREQQMPPEYYETLNSLMSSTYATLDRVPALYSAEVAKRWNACTSVADNTLYSGTIQRELITLIDTHDDTKEVLFEAVRGLAAKVLLPGKWTLDEAHMNARHALEQLDDPSSEMMPIVPRRGNYIEGIHGTMAAAITFRKAFAHATSKDCMAFLYENATRIGADNKKFHSASPIYKDRGHGATDDHNAALFWKGIEAGYYGLEPNEGAKYPAFTIAEKPMKDGEFHSSLPRQDPVTRVCQEGILRQRRRQGGACPARYKIRLPDGEMKEKIRWFSDSIRERYEVDPKILVYDEKYDLEKLDVTALMIARVIEAGDHAVPGQSLWTHGFEAYGVPVAA